MKSKSLSTCLLLMCLCLLMAQPGHSQEQVAKNVEESKQALSKLGNFIGEWRGTGQERRGSTKGAWREEGEFVWDFSTAVPAIKYVVVDGKHVTQSRITWNGNDNLFEMKLTTPENVEQAFSGTWENDKLQFTSTGTNETATQRITFTPLNEKRTLVLFEKASSNATSFYRVGEVGYTRAGTRLAIPGGGQRECVVTGGTGTTPVMYKGETYYVCCSGCKQAFDDDPEGIIAEFRVRLAARKAEATK